MHGFVRTKEWRLDSVTVEEDGSVAVVCSTESDAFTRLWWPYEFRLVHRIVVGKTLRLELTASNTGSESLRFEEALHTYFLVGDARRVRVQGLDQVAYLDNTDGNQEKTQTGDLVFTAKTDNAYLNTEAALDLIDPVLHRIIRTEKTNSATTVVWNPWEQGATAMPDFGDGEWDRMTCVEASNIRGSAVTLAPGEEHTMRAALSVGAD
jgi:glucose-6-phosphate 1-epimerase